MSHVVAKKRSRKKSDTGDDSDSDLGDNDEVDARPSSPVMYGYSDSQGTLLPNPLESSMGDNSGLPAREHSTEANIASDDDDDIDDDNASEATKRRRLNRRNFKRDETTYDQQTGELLVTMI